jgi:hypothetical protein
VFITQVIHHHMTKMAFCVSCAEAKGMLPTGDPPTYKLPPELEVLGLPTVTMDEVLREMGMDPAAEMMKSQAEILNLPEGAPTEVSLPDSMTVLKLAGVLHAQAHQVILVLLQHGKFTKSDDEIDFVTAALVCEQFAVTARRA